MNTTSADIASSLLSLIVPVYNESETLHYFFEAVLPVLASVTEEWEIICVNDGSRDDTLMQLECWHAKDARIKIISFSRNFGKEAALSAGLDAATGQAIIPMDVDLQDPPAVITEMLEKWREGYKVVIATRRTREGESWLKRYTAHLFYRLLALISKTPIPENTGDFRLMDRQVVEAVKLLPERTRFMKGLLAWVGFSTYQLYYDRKPRVSGTTKWDYIKLFSLALDGIFSFTTIPLKIWTYLGLFISTIALFYALFLIIRTLVYGIDVPGYSSIMVAILFMGGIQLISLGVIGEYLGRIFKETKQRPLYIIEKTVGLVTQHARHTHQEQNSVTR